MTTIPAMNFSGPYLIKFDNSSTQQSRFKKIITDESNIFSCGRVNEYSQIKDLTNTNASLIRNGSYITKSDLVGNPEWVILFDGDFTSISTDGSNIYSVGTKGTNASNIYSADGSKYTVPYTHSYSAVVSKFNCKGIHQWSKYSVYGENFGKDIKFGDGNVYVTVDKNILKFNQNGQILWNKSMSNLVSLTIMNNNVYAVESGINYQLSVVYKYNTNGVLMSNILYLTNSIITSITSDVSNVYILGNVNSNSQFYSNVVPISQIPGPRVILAQISENGNVNWMNFITGNVTPTSINSNLYMSALYSGTSNVLFTNSNVAFSLTTSNTSFIAQYTSSGTPIQVLGFTSNVVGVTGNLFTVTSSGTISKFKYPNIDILDRWTNTSNTSNIWRVVLPANTNVNSIQFTLKIPATVNVYTNYQTLQTGPLTYSNNFANFIEYSNYRKPGVMPNPLGIREFEIIGNVGSNVFVFTNQVQQPIVRNSNISGITLLSNHGSLFSFTLVKRVVFASPSNVTQLNAINYGLSGNLSNLTYTGNVNIWTDGPHNYFYDQPLSNSIIINGFKQTDDPVFVSTNKYSLFYPFKIVNQTQDYVSFFGNFEIDVRSNDWANTQFTMDSISTSIGSVVGNVIHYTKTSNGLSPFMFTGNMLFANEITFTGYTSNIPNIITTANVVYSTTPIIDMDLGLREFTLNITRSDNSYAFDSNFNSFSTISNVSLINTNINDTGLGYYSFANIYGYFTLPQTGTYTANVISAGANVIFNGNLQVIAESVQYFNMKIYNQLGTNTYVDVILSNIQSNVQYRLSDYTFTDDEITKIPNFYKSNTARTNYKTI